MSNRHLPVRPNLEQLRHQAKDLLSLVHNGNETAVTEFLEHHPERPAPSAAKLADAQLALARSYGVPSWPRLVTACKVIELIRAGDVAGLRSMVLKDPKLLTENARGVEECNWGPPMSYAANVGQDGIISMLRELGARDLQKAFDRACLQGRLGTARMLFEMGARPQPGCVMGPCETLNAEGLGFLFELGAELADENGDRLAPVGLILETYSRNPSGKHGCMELVASRMSLPGAATVALHRGRLDLLDQYLALDPGLLSRTFSHREIYPLELGCHEDPALALHGTPVGGGTLLHLAVDDDAVEIVQWFLDRGGDVNAQAAVDSEGFGGHTALFGCTVSQPYRCGRQRDGAMAQLLLDAGADPSVRASLRKELRFAEDETMHEYRDVSALEWGQKFHNQAWVNPAATKKIAAESSNRRKA